MNNDFPPNENAFISLNQYIFSHSKIYEKDKTNSGDILCYLVCMDIKYYLPLKKFRQQVNARLAFVEDEIS